MDENRKISRLFDLLPETVSYPVKRLPTPRQPETITSELGGRP